MNNYAFGSPIGTIFESIEDSFIINSDIRDNDVITLEELENEKRNCVKLCFVNYLSNMSFQIK